ncbi:MAG: zinc ribbon domain-containing protein [Bacteroidota bacterium]|nr:zinc ribbon domain-containing protein [Bacteroidota bacterium]
MICNHCQSDNPRGALECTACGTKLHAVKHGCGFVNSLTDFYCGGCGQSILKMTTQLKQKFNDDMMQPEHHFSEQELLTLLDIHQRTGAQRSEQHTVSQKDIDKLFQQ